MGKRFGYIIPKIIEDSNMNAAFDEVVGGLEKERRAKYEEKRTEIIASLKKEIGEGTFRITKFEEFYVKEATKLRLIQSPRVYDRIGCNAIMRVVERYLYPSVIPTSAASIKGRGMHRLYRKMRTDIRHDREGTKFYYSSDIEHFYQNIPQDAVIAILKDKIKDPVLLPMLISFVRLLPEGISIGLRSSQCYGNLLLSPLDHRMKEVEGFRYYYRYCDDIRVYASNKADLWRARAVIHEEIAKLNMRIKPNEAIRPATEGNDFLGYVDFGDHTRLRKRTKQNAARKLHEIKNRRRRREIIGSFKGMAKWGDCNHLYKALTGRNMKSFKELGLQYVAEDGKKRFDGKSTSLRALTNIHITIMDFEKDVDTKNGKRTLVSFKYDDGTKGKYFTSDKEQEWYLQQIQQLGELPFDTTITAEVFGDGSNKVRYRFS